MICSLPRTLAMLALAMTLIADGAGMAIAADEDMDDAVIFSSAEEASLSGWEMESNRGAFGITEQTSEQTLSAATTGNSLNVGGSLSNGNISLGDNISGFGSYVMNTGNNSTINSAVSVNVQLAPVAP